MNKALKALKEIECRLDRAIGILEREQPTSADIIDCLEAEKAAPEAERPSTRPDVPPEAPAATRQAWDKMDKATEVGEFTKKMRTKVQQWKQDYRKIFNYDIELIPIKELLQACDMLDRLEEKIKFYEKYDKDVDGYMAEVKQLRVLITAKDKENERLKRKLADGLLIDYDVLSASKPEDILDMIRKARKGQK